MGMKAGEGALGRDRSVHGAGMPSTACSGATSADFEALAPAVIVQTCYRAVKLGFLVP